MKTERCCGSPIAMVSLTRLVLWTAVLVGIPLFLVLQGEASLMTQIAGGAILLALISILMFSGRSPVPKPSRKKDTVAVEELKDEIELPAPVLELEGASERREGKIQRSRGRVAQPAVPPMPAPPAMPMPPQAEVAPDGEASSLPPMPVMPDDGSQVAARYVAASDPQSELETEIETFVGQRRERRAEIRSKLERKRRMVLAERRAAKVRMWSAVEDGEDLAAILKDPNHGLIVLEEPESPDTSKPQGISYVRIDESRVLKLRMPLEVPEKERPAPPEPEMPELPPLPPPGGMPPPPGLPPMPPPPGMPPMPPPVTSDDA